MLAAAHRHVLRMEQGYSQALTRREREVEDREARADRREADLTERAATIGKEERFVYRQRRDELRAALLLVVHRELGHTFHMSDTDDGAVADSRIVDAVMARL